MVSSWWGQGCWCAAFSSMAYSPLKPLPEGQFQPVLPWVAGRAYPWEVRPSGSHSMWDACCHPAMPCLVRCLQLGEAHAFELLLDHVELFLVWKLAQSSWSPTMLLVPSMTMWLPCCVACQDPWCVTRMLLAGAISTLRAKAGTWRCEYIFASWLQGKGQNLECKRFSGVFPFGNNSGGFQEPRNQVPKTLSLFQSPGKGGPGCEWTLGGGVPHTPCCPAPPQLSRPRLGSLVLCDSDLACGFQRTTVSVTNS